MKTTSNPQSKSKSKFVLLASMLALAAAACGGPRATGVPMSGLPGQPQTQALLQQALYQQALQQQALYQQALQQQALYQQALQQQFYGGGQQQGGAWSHYSSVGNDNMSVGGDGNGFVYFLDNKGNSWSSGN